MKKDDPYRYFIPWLEEHGLSLPDREYVFAPPRRWRFDFAWLEPLVALEVEGGVFGYGRHNRASGFIKDMIKYNTATCLGWSVLRVLPKDLCMQETLDLLKACGVPSRDAIPKQGPSPFHVRKAP